MRLSSSYAGGMSATFSHEPDASRYAMHLDGSLVAVLDYRTNAGQISFNHTFTNPVHRGKGFAAQLVEFAVDDVEKTTELKIVPMCWYVGDWFAAHPERSALLSR